MQTLREYKEKKIVSADSEDFELEKLDQEKKGKSGHGKDQVLVRVDKEKLGDKVSEVETGERLIESPVCVVGETEWEELRPTGHENDAGNGRCHAGSFVKCKSTRTFHNPGALRAKSKDEETASLVADQLLDNAMASANLLDDPREMIARSYRTLRN